MSKSNLILVRHGQSEWNRLDQFTGWVDVGLSKEGFKEAENAGKKINKTGIKFDFSFSSILKRSVQTYHQINDICDISSDLVKDWRLNERHYGKLQGLNKQKMRDTHGDDQVLIWRRSYDVRPPELEAEDLDKLMNQKCFVDQKIEPFPKCESLKDTYERVLNYYKEEIERKLIKKNILISAHGNSIRALCKFLFKLDNDQISRLEYFF